MIFALFTSFWGGGGGEGEEQARLPPTSQGGRDEYVRAVLFDDVVNELLCSGSPAEQAYAPLELRHQGYRIVEKVSPLDGCVPHLPTGKLPKEQQRDATQVSADGRGRPRGKG